MKIKVMKNKNSLTFLLFLVFPFLLNAQVENTDFSHKCFADQLHQKMLSEHPFYYAKHQGMEREIYKLENEPSFSSTTSVTTQTIPVVVHVIHQNGPENISDAQVFDAIQHLNDAFANIDFYDPNTGVDVGIDFCLAIRDPENNSSNGINRIESALTNVTVETQDFDLKALLQWNPLDYLNIWVVNEITSLSAGSGVAGYANFPAVHGLPADGIVIEANYTGSSQDNSKVLVHEAGHYLGLYHTFEGGCNNDDCQTNGDRVCDTPPDQSTAPVACSEVINTCNTDEDDTSTNNPFRSIALGGLGDQNDMYINYMDYGHLPCYSAFTQGQKERMNNALSTTRQSLLESYGCQQPCPFASYDAAFLSTPPSPVLAGELVNFTNTSDPANFYEWSVDNQVISNTFNTSYTFNDEGVFTVNLVIRDTINSCKSSFQQTIEVICQGEASFTTTSTEIQAGETLDFTNTSTGNTSYEWFLDGVSYSTDTDLNITFTNSGYYTIYLVGATATCLNYSSTITIIVGSCEMEDKSEMHWYFGENAALDFNSGEPVNVPGSQLNSFEGTACISDDNGDLLFYTDGINIWDATNTVMPNGSGLLGGANTSSWNGAFIVPRPYNPSQYYVFTCDEFENNIANGVNYSIVDMNLNGGLGDVTDTKNIFLCPANVETISATYHDDGQKVWLVISDYDVVNTYLIDSTGIGSPIAFSDPNYNTSWGFTRFFNSGKRLILSQANILGATFLVILDFDNTTGIFTNPIEINTSSSDIWSFEISPDDSRLYAVLGEGINTHSLYQFDLSLTTASQISNSKTYIDNIYSLDRLLLGPNGKIYNTVFFEPFLRVINNPNELGINCNYSGTINLSPASNNVSLPKFIRGQRSSDLNLPILSLGPDQTICDGLTTVLDPGANADFEIIWQDGSTDSTYTAWLPGTYWVTSSNECGTVTDSITISLEELNLVDLGDDINFCVGDNILLDAGTTGDYYLWQDGSNNPTLVVTEAGNYWVDVSTQAGCYESDSISITLDTEAPVVDCPLDIDTIVPFGTTEVQLNPFQPMVTDNCSYTFVNDFTNTNDATANYPVGTTTLVWTVTDANGNSTTCDMDIIISVNTGTEDIDAQSASLILYPNPSNGLFILEETHNNINDIQLTVFDPLGRSVHQESVFLQGKIQIDLTEQATGVYFLHWSTSESSGTFKLIYESR